MKTLNTLLRTDDSTAALIVRLTLGLAMLPHGLQKTLGLFGGHGFSGTMGFFTGQMGIPWIFAFAAILAESLGALGLITGTLTRVAAAGVAVVMLVAVATVHGGNGFFMNWSGSQKGEGFEYHILALGLAIAAMIAGGGRFSVDRMLARGRKQ